MDNVFCDVNHDPHFEIYLCSTELIDGTLCLAKIRIGDENVLMEGKRKCAEEITETRGAAGTCTSHERNVSRR